MPPTVAEVVDLVVRLEDDVTRRNVLDGQPYGFFRAAADDGLVDADGIDSFAEVIGFAVKQGALGYRSQHGGAMLPPPDALWTAYAFQSRIGYYATLAGQQIAALYRQRQQERPATSRELGVSLERVTRTDKKQRDVFICHASEDKNSVARPLAEALTARGWTVWLDELELTIGDSLSGLIENALVESRFGVAVLSPASFAKEWPQRELAGLAAREVDAGSKVILPVWHKVDRHYITQRSPILADRLGALTSAGIEDVADKISAALARSGMQAITGLPPTAIVQSIDPKNGGLRLSIPGTAEEQQRLAAERPDWWEYRLFAGVLLQGMRALETKWDDHELRLPRGARRDIDQESAFDFMGREMSWIGKQVGLLDRIFDSSVQEQAFGPKGQAGDPARIEAFARRVVASCESLLDWAAALRATTVPENFEEVTEATACFVDAPLGAIRDFINTYADQISRLPELAADATEDKPVRIELALSVQLDPEVKKRHDKALHKLRQELIGG